MTIAWKSFPSAVLTKYSTLRPQLKDGDLLFCSGSYWFSNLIQSATESVWSHVAFVMTLPSIDRVMVLESVESRGVRTVPLSKYLHDYDNNGNPYKGGMALARHDGFQDKVAGSATQKIFGQFAVDRFGYPYDNDEIAKIAARVVSGYLPFPKRTRKKLERDKEYICSEYVWECYDSAGVQVPWSDNGFIAPADFARASDVKLLGVIQNK